MGACSSKTRYTHDDHQDLPDKYFPKFEKTVPNLKGKVMVVTGSTSGTGYYAARTFAKNGATVVMLNRSSSRAVTAEKNIVDELPGDVDIRTIDCDLMDLDSVRSAAEILKKDFKDSGIDVLCNNAGIMCFPNKATGDGYDVQMQTNHLSHFLLTRELYTLLEKAAEAKGEARIINHSSMARKGKPLDAKYLGKNGGDPILGDDKMDWTKGGKFMRYHQTKLANVVFTLALRDKLKRKGSNVMALVCAPGIATTKIAVNTNIEVPKWGVALNLGSWFMQSSADGSMPLIHCSVAPDVESGNFFEPRWSLFGNVNKIDVEKEKVCGDPFARKMLWEESEKAVGTWDL